MAVHPLELRPRSAASIMDASVRLCLHSSGVWLLVLPGVLAMTAALQLAWQGIEQERLLPATFALTAAWILRALCQGAATHHLRELLLETSPAPVSASIRAALRRFPTLVFVATGMSVWRWGLALGSLGVSLVFGGASSTWYAVAMQRTGPLRKLGAEARSQLGQGTNKALRIQLLMGFQLLAALNLHVLVGELLSLGRGLLALDVAYLQQLTSASNPYWVLLVVAVVFGAFEPVRAALGTLLLLDARVRRDGVDLLARLEALPRRHQGRARQASAAAWLLAALLPLLIPASAWAAQDDFAVAPQPPPTDTSAPAHSGAMSDEAAGRDTAQLPVGPPVLSDAPEQRALPSSGEEAVTRLSRLAAACGEPDALIDQDAQAIRSGAANDDVALSRWAGRLESLAASEVGCATAMEQLRLDTWVAKDALGVGTRVESPEASLAAILARPEFARALPKVEEEAERSWFASWLGDLLQRFEAWFEKLLEDLAKDEEKERPSLDATFLPSAGGAVAEVLFWILIAGAVVVVLVLLLRALRGPGGATEATAELRVAEGSDSASGMESALSRTATTWISLADQLASEGRYREAVRHVYLALLAGLHARGAIQYDPNASNWDHLRGFQGTAPHRSAFRALTSSFDAAWYGREPVRPDVWSAFRERAVSLLPTQEGVRHA